MKLCGFRFYLRHIQSAPLTAFGTLSLLQYGYRIGIARCFLHDVRDDDDVHPLICEFADICIEGKPLFPVEERGRLVENKHTRLAYESRDERRIKAFISSDMRGERTKV